LFYDIFFFQAEDGIRDFHVTGVQTCALPISHFGANPETAASNRFQRRIAPADRRTHDAAIAAAALAEFDALADALARAGIDVHRSEERRVGEEGSSGASRESDERKRSNTHMQ